MFNKQHYEAIARLLAAHHQHPTRLIITDSDIVLDRVVEDFADMFSDDNPNFDRKKFGDAAGY